VKGEHRLSKTDLTQIKTGHYIIFFIISSILIFALYGNTLKGPFVFDDYNSIVENNSLHWRQPISLTDISNSLASHRPIADLTFGLNYYFGKLNVKGYHLVNISLHLMNTLFLFYFLTLIFKLRALEKGSAANFHAEFIITLLWSASPLQTQAIDYIVQRVTLLACLFYLLSLISYMKARTTPFKKNILWFSLSILFGALALFSKENAAMLPVTILICEFFFISGLHAGEFKRFLRKTAPLLLLVGCFIVLFLIYHPEIRDIFSHRSNIQEFTLRERVMTEWRILVYYLSLLLFPYPGRLLLDYFYPLSKSLFSPVTTIFSLMFIVFLIGVSIKKASQFPFIAFGICWFFLNLLIESTIIPVDLIFEHRLYLPSIGFFIGIVALATEWLSRWNLSKAKIIGFILFSLILILEGIFTYQRNQEWNSETFLWTQVIEKYPNQARAHFNLARQYERLNLPAQAETEYAKAVMLRPGDFAAHNNYANLLFRRGDTQTALEEYKKAVALDPNAVQPSVNVGKIYAATGRPDLGIKEIETFLARNPHPEAYKSLGEIYISENKIDMALQAYKKALALSPEDVGILSDLGTLTAATGDFKLSENYLQRALLINPRSDELHRALGSTYQSQGLYQAALNEYLKVLEINPENLFIHYHIGKLYQEGGHLEEAVSEYEKAIKINPTKNAVSLLYQVSALAKDPSLQLRINRLLSSFRE
jgi:tetratricopeptide (TPR) repeat protein